MRSPSVSASTASLAKRRRLHLPASRNAETDMAELTQYVLNADIYKKFLKILYQDLYKV